MNKLLITLFILKFSFLMYSSEPLDRGLFALQNSGNSVYIGWRLFKNDADDMIFSLKKAVVGNYNQIPANKDYAEIKKGLFTDFIDSDVKENDIVYYKIFSYAKDGSISGTDTVKISIVSYYNDFISIKLKGDYIAQKIGIGDLDGDKKLDYVIKQPSFNVDPYQKEGYWKKSESTYKIEAYNHNGLFMWEYDMGWAVEEGIWYSPYIVYDVDGDGKAEIYCKGSDGKDYRNSKGLVEKGPEYLLKLDGETGKVTAKTDWISRKSYPEYNFYSRNFLTVAYLDGVNPYIIMIRGTYNLIKINAFDKNLNLVWEWQAKEYDVFNNYWGQGGHGVQSADIDNDGRDEIIIGAAAIDDNGKGLWTLGLGHPDMFYLSDITDKNPGLEIFYGFEKKQNYNGICLVDAKTGKILWGLKEPTTHIHSQGMFGDVLKDYPGIEFYAGERDKSKIWLVSSEGKIIKTYSKNTLNIRGLWWDNDVQKEVVYDKTIMDFEGASHRNIEGSLIAVMDVIGDYREEAITSLKGEIRIYTTTMLSDKVHPYLLGNHQYRMGAVNYTMGYFYPPQVDYMMK